MSEIIQRFYELLQIPLSIESDQDDTIKIAVTGDNNFNDYKFITLLRGLIKYNLLEKINYEKNNDELKVSFSMIKRNIDNELIDEMLDTIKEKPYLINDFDDDVINLTTELDVLLLGLYSNGIIEYDVLQKMVSFKLEGMDNKTLPLSSAISFVDELNRNSDFTKKFVNGGNCDFDIKSKIITPEEIQEAALAYSEGNESLRELLEFCFSNDIWTTACCKGHSNRDDKNGFVTFNIDYNNTRDFFEFFTNKLLHSNLNELIKSDEYFTPIPNYPTCSLSVSKGLFYTGGTLLYQYDHADQILQLTLECAKEYVGLTSSLNDSLSHGSK